MKGLLDAGELPCGYGAVCVAGDVTDLVFTGEKQRWLLFLLQCQWWVSTDGWCSWTKPLLPTITHQHHLLSIVYAWQFMVRHNRHDHDGITPVLAHNNSGCPKVVQLTMSTTFIYHIFFGWLNLLFLVIPRYCNINGYTKLYPSLSKLTVPCRTMIWHDMIIRDPIWSLKTHTKLRECLRPQPQVVCLDHSQHADANPAHGLLAAEMRLGVCWMTCQCAGNWLTRAS